VNPDLPLIVVTSRSEWRNWLAQHHEQPTGVWAVTKKKKAMLPGGTHVSAIDINEECLCFGWIDSKPATVDDDHSGLLCTPRRPTSGWSKVNKARLQRLLAGGLVAPPGQAAIARAKANGSWTALDLVDSLVVPNDLRTELQRFQHAEQNFGAFPPSTRKAILEWIGQAKRAETRQARIATTAESAERKIRANQWRQ
jgi:uncharacterized protein YdeI (YjbR/CyaY-like superfamily)